MSIQHVEAFYEQLSQDETFRDQIKNAKSKVDCSHKVQAAGYDFTQQEFEDYTAQLLENGVLNNGNLEKIGERELEAVYGGIYYYNPRDLGQIYGGPSIEKYDEFGNRIFD
jgi:predicted ribosomally synthesized peptide with nif11-like leader